MTKITDKQFAEALKAVAAERPAHVYVKAIGGPNGEVCIYHRDGDLPGCLIGETLARLGVDQNTLAAKSGEADTVLPDFGLSDQCAEAALVAQIRQDGGDKWGDCAEAYASAYDNWEPQGVIDLLVHFALCTILAGLAVGLLAALAWRFIDALFRGKP